MNFSEKVIQVSVFSWRILSKEPHRIFGECQSVEHRRAKDIEELHAKVGQFTIERDF